MKAIAAMAALFVVVACTGSTPVAAGHAASPSATSSVSPSGKGPLATFPPQETIVSMRMTSLRVMWAATDTRVLRSTDAGREWTDVTPSNRPGRLDAFFALDDSSAWTVHGEDRASSITVMRTTDGGTTWQRVPAPSDGIGPTEITFVDRLHGWILIDGGVAAGSQAIAILRTLDGGVTWSIVATSGDPTTGRSASGIQFGCDKGGFAFGSSTVGLLPTSCATNQQYVYRTTDGGLHWSSVELPALGGVFQPYFVSPVFVTTSDAVMQGGPGLAVTHDGGASWSVYRLPGTGSIDFESTASGWQLNDSTLSATSDGGRTWHATGSRLPFRGTDMSLQYLGNGVAVAFWWRGTTAYRTDDGGASWRSVAPGGLTD